jgi:hypothetical protein
MRAVLLLVISLFARLDAAAQAAPVTATMVDGSTAVGELRGWNANEVLLDTSAGQKRIGSDQLISLRWPPQITLVDPAAGPASLAELTDGTLIPMSSLRIAGKAATLTLGESTADKGGGKEKTIDVLAAQLAAVRFQRLDPGLEGQWKEIRLLKSANDLLVVLKKDGKSLDYVEGVLGDITDEKVEFKLDGELNRVDRAKVAGVIYSRQEQQSAADPRMVLQGRSGLRASAAKVELADSMLNITTAGNVKLAWPIDDIELIDYSAGKILYLSDIEPASQNWSPLVGVPAGATLAAAYGQPRRDRSAFGSKLSLLIKNENGDDSPQGATRIFNKGLSLRSRTELVYRVPAGFKRFTAIAGIDPATISSGNLRLAILADDHPLLETEIAGDQPPQPIDVEISGVKRLKILVDFGQNLDSGDWLNLCDAKIVK